MVFEMEDMWLFVEKIAQCFDVQSDTIYARINRKNALSQGRLLTQIQTCRD